MTDEDDAFRDESPTFAEYGKDGDYFRNRYDVGQFWVSQLDLRNSNSILGNSYNFDTPKFNSDDTRIDPSLPRPPPATLSSLTATLLGASVLPSNTNIQLSTYSLPPSNPHSSAWPSEIPKEYFRHDRMQSLQSLVQKNQSLAALGGMAALGAVAVTLSNASSTPGLGDKPLPQVPLSPAITFGNFFAQPTIGFINIGTLLGQPAKNVSYGAGVKLSFP